jgi:DNA-binding NtrC family response regulator
MKNRKNLIVDDEKNLRESLVELVESEGYEAEQASDGAEALLKIRAADFAGVFLDIKMPRMDGLQVLAKLRDENLTDTPIVIISAFGDSERTIEAMRLGAFDYITKPLDIAEILQILKRAVRQFEASRADEHKSPKKVSGESKANENTQIIGTSRAMREVFKQIGRVSVTDATVLITGESGTGKELAARAIHEHSARTGKPFVAVNCGALPENLIEAELFGFEKGAFTGAAAQKKGRFELASGGTIFLDEIGEMPLSAQVKLLRVLQERKIERVGGVSLIPVDVRVIAATNRDLPAEIHAKNFREDLFYRLNVVSIRLPPLRERLADVGQLAEYFLERAVRKHKLPNKNLSDSALRSLMNLDYTGNVRELENVIERAAVAAGFSGSILPEHLGSETARQAAPLDQNFLKLPFKEAVSALEKALIENALRESGGNRTDAARALGINRRLLYDKIAEHKIHFGD